jgi:Lrp/AsnC family leucine-responsive transcriptional regulator
MNLDDFDVRILEMLQDRGDLTMEELSEKVCRSYSQCSRRVKQLREAGFIQKFAAILDPQTLGLTIKAYISVVLVQHSQNATEFHDLIQQCPEVLECSMTTGDGDFLLKVYTRDLVHFRELLRQLASIKQVATLKSSIVVEDTKNTSALPIYSA